MAKETRIRYQVVKADLHTHLATGSDLSHISFNQVINIMRKRLGGGILGLTNFEDCRYDDFIEKPGYERVNYGNAIYVPDPKEGKDALIVNCQELFTREGSHVLVLGIEQGVRLRSGWPLGNILSNAKERGLAVILPHLATYQGALKEINKWVKESIDFIKRNKKSCRTPIFNLPGELKNYGVSGIEVYNAQAALGIPRFANTRAREFQEDMVRWGLDIGAIASGDGHSLREIGRTYTELIIPRYEHITDKDSVKNHLRKAISSAKRFKGRMQPAKFEAIEHLMALAYYMLRNRLFGEE
jgi:hypothetical protein